MEPEKPNRGIRLVGVGAAACVACCAGPIFGLLAAAGLLTIAAYVTVGLAGLAVAAPLALWAYRRRKGASTCVSGNELTRVELGAKPTPAP